MRRRRRKEETPSKVDHRKSICDVAVELITSQENDKVAPIVPVNEGNQGIRAQLVLTMGKETEMENFNISSYNDGLGQPLGSNLNDNWSQNKTDNVCNGVVNYCDVSGYWTVVWSRQLCGPCS